MSTFFLEMQTAFIELPQEQEETSVPMRNKAIYETSLWSQDTSCLRVHAKHMYSIIFLSSRYGRLELWYWHAVFIFFWDSTYGLVTFIQSSLRQSLREWKHVESRPSSGPDEGALFPIGLADRSVKLPVGPNLWYRIKHLNSFEKKVGPANGKNGHFRWQQLDWRNH